MEVRPEFQAEAIAAIRAHPAFHDVIRTEVAAGLDFHDRNGPFHRSINEMPVFVLGMLALSLHYTGELSHRRLRELGSRSWVSTGRATAILWRLRRAGLIRPIGVRGDGSPRSFEPEPDLIETYRERVRIALEAVSLIDGHAGEAAARLHDDQVFRPIVIGLAADMLGAGESAQPEMLAFSRLTVLTFGLLMLYHMLDALFAEGARRPVGECQVQLSAMARRFPVSRSHVRRFLGEMERAGFLKRTDDPATMRLTEQFGADFELYCAYSYATLIAHSRRSLEAAGAASGAEAG